MEGTLFLPLPEGLSLTQISQEESTLVLEVVSERFSSCCPLCTYPSDSIHSRYCRTVRDVPCGGQAVRLHLQVRKFFCQNPGCVRRIFTERLPGFVDSWGQMTLRLIAILQATGLATSGSLGTRLAARLGISASWMTILRRVMALATPEASSVTVLGIDDFSFKRGRKFGTILVDLSTHQVIDLLPERSVESAAAWMQSHPEIAYVSRDRGNDYAQATRKGAPQATPVADRFHLYKNLVEAIEPMVTRCCREIRKQLPPLPKPDRSRLPKAKEWRPTPAPFHERQRLSRLATNQERFEYMIELQKLGIPQDEIARRLGVTTRTIQNWNNRGSCPGSIRRRKRRSLFDPYAPYVLKRWKQGCKKGSQLYREIKVQGYTGTDRQVYRFLQTLKQEPVELPALPVISLITAQEALWLIARPFHSLNEEERALLAQLCQGSSELATLHTLVQSFGRLIRNREGHRLEDWKKQVVGSGITELQRFVKGLERDQEAVLVGLTVAHSNGQVEGFVNKLKLIKRQSYGRASFPLLRQRVLHAL